MDEGKQDKGFNELVEKVFMRNFSQPFTGDEFTPEQVEPYIKAGEDVPEQVKAHIKASVEVLIEFIQETPKAGEPDKAVAVERALWFIYNMNR